MPATRLLAGVVAPDTPLVLLAAQWWRPVRDAAAATTAAAEPECVFVNHVGVGPGHPYRQEKGEKCRYEIEPRTTY